MTIYHSSNGTYYYILAENDHFLHSDLIIRRTTAPFETGRYSSIRDAQEVIDAYTSKVNQLRTIEVYTFHEPRAALSGWYVRTINDFDLFLLPDGTIDTSLNGREYFKNKESAIDAIRIYNKKHIPATIKIHKLLEPRASKHNPDKWVVETEDKLAFLRVNGKVEYGLNYNDTTAYFPTYTSALFHKLRYERLNKGV